MRQGPVRAGGYGPFSETMLRPSSVMMQRALRIGMIPADGIGREVLPVAQRVLEATPGLPKMEFVPLQAGFELFQKTGEALPQQTIDVLKNECDAAMFGSVSSPSHKVEGYSSPIVRLRKELGLYANIRPVSGPVLPGAQFDKPIDMVTIRENTECLVRCLADRSTSSPRLWRRRPRAKWRARFARSRSRRRRVSAARHSRWRARARRCARPLAARRRPR